jgi:hypothetical protein
MESVTLNWMERSMFLINTLYLDRVDNIELGGMCRCVALTEVCVSVCRINRGLCVAITEVCVSVCRINRGLLKSSR